MPVRGVAIALSVAAVLVLAGTAAMVTDGAPRLAGPAPIAPQAFVVEIPPDAEMCQDRETVYEGTGAIAMTLGTYGQPGPPVRLSVKRDGRPLAAGGLPPGWKEGTVHVPIEPQLNRRASPAEVCLANRGGTPIAVGGEHVDPSVGMTVDGRPHGGRASFRNLLGGEPSLLELAGKVAERYARGNASWLAPWTWILIVALAAASLVAAGRALLVSGREGGRVPPAAAWCAVAALLAGLTWSLVTPPFHVPDEISHVSYAQGLVETGELPRVQPGEPYSIEEQRLLATLRFYDVIGNPIDRPPWTRQHEQALRDIEAEPLPRESTNALTASPNPPLYYLLQAPVYAATSSGSLLDQLPAMRVLSVLLGALTVLAVFLFVRELLPRAPWTWTAGALAVAFQPVFLFISSGVNADALLFTCSAVALLAMARLLRRGLSVGRAAALGGAVAAGALTKPLFLALVPAALAALGLAVLRARPVRVRLRQIGAAVGAAAAAAVLPVVAFNVLASELLGHEGSTSAVSSATRAVGAGSLREELSFIWQLFLPRAPWMNDLLPGVPPNDIWLHGFVGRLGWLDYSFSPWVVDVARWVLLGVLALAVAALVAHRGELRARWAEAGCYAVAVAGVLAAIGTQHYATTLVPGTPGFTQARYLFPLLALYAALVALAVRAFGVRAGPVAAVGVLAVAAVHNIAALALTVSRFYA